MKKNKKDNKGFTLIEMLVVLACISLAASVIFASMNSARNRAKISKASAEVRNLYQALLRYNIDKVSWPPGCNNIDTTEKWNDPDNGLVPYYILSTIQNDPWGTPYFFDGCPNIECSPTNNSSICSAGPNKVFESWDRADHQPQGDDICIFFEENCF